MNEEQSLPIDLGSVSEALRQPLALLGDGDRRQQVETFASIARPNQERAIVDLLAHVVTFVNEHGDQRFRLQQESDGLRLYVAEEATDASTGFAAGETLDKVTIRLPAHLKQMIEQLAGGRGMSLNTWYVWALGRAAMRQTHRGPMEHGGPARHGHPNDRGAGPARTRGRQFWRHSPPLDADMPD